MVVMSVGLGAFLAVTVALGHWSRAPDERAWRLHQVTADGRGLVLTYDGGGCSKDNGRARVVETATSVRIRVVSPHEDEPLGGSICPAVFRQYTTTARLRRPLDGRAVRGGPRCSICFDSTRRMPRVIGLRVNDARRLLSVFPLAAADPSIRGPSDGVVVQQDPPAGARLFTRHRHRLSHVRLGTE